MIDNKALDKLVVELNMCVPKDQHLNKDGLCGLFYALAITPAIIEPADWMSELFYGERPELTGKQVKELKKAVVAVVKSSNRLLLAKQLKFPFDFASLDDEKLNSIWHWSYGFLQGLRLRMSFWQSGIIASETSQTFDVVRSSVNIFTALIEEDISVLDNLDTLKSQLIAAGREPTDALILASLLPTLPEAYECIRLFAAKMSERLMAQQHVVSA
ncbi:MAG: UPF0149 family protein [Methylomonas sp.]|nr:UPF0149 family protein [Methylomonas sp.]